MIDTTDRKIAKILQLDGRITIKALADQLHLTTTPVFERVKRLEKEGIISKYVALLNPKKVNRNLIVFISISLKNHTRSYLDKFVTEMRSYDEIMECYHIAGNFDYLLKAQLSDMESFQQFILNKLSVNSNIAHVQSSFVLSKDKYSTALNI